MQWSSDEEGKKPKQTPFDPQSAYLHQVCLKSLANAIWHPVLRPLGVCSLFPTVQSSAPYRNVSLGMRTQRKQISFWSVPTHPHFSELAIAQLLHELEWFAWDLPHILGLHWQISQLGHTSPTAAHQTTAKPCSSLWEQGLGLAKSSDRDRGLRKNRENLQYMGTAQVFTIPLSQLSKHFFALFCTFLHLLYHTICFR